MDKSVSNRGGRKPGQINKITQDIRKAAGEYSSEALAVLVEHMRGDDKPSQYRAACEILDRAHGRSVQGSIDLTPPRQQQEISNLELARWVGHLLSKGIEQQQADKVETAPIVINDLEHKVN